MLIKSVKVINYNEVINNADVEIKNGKIFKITPKKGSAKKILIPGFIDQHIHGFSGKDSMDGAEAIEYMSNKLPEFGTTSFLPTVMTASNLNEALKEASKAETKASRILGIHAEGPFLSIEKKGAHDEKYIVKATKARIDKMIKLSNGTIRKMTIAPENFSKKYLPTLFKNNIVPSLGHSNTSGYEASKYFALGVPSTTHLWNAMSGVANRNPGLVETSLTNEAVTTEMILDFVHVDRTTAKLTIEAKGPETITLVTDSIRPAGLPDGDSVSGGLKVTKKGNLITLKGKDTIAGSGATMLDNFKNVIALGYDYESAVAMTSYNASLILGEDELGIIKKGYKADLVILNKDLEIEQTIIDGEIKYVKNN